MPSVRLLLFAVVCLFLAGCSTIIVEKDSSGHAALFDSKPVKVEEGMASWYRDRRTASGEKFDVNALTAAHRKLPFGTNVRVVDLKTHKSIIVRINDRGPYKKGRIIDLTAGAARQLGVYDRGIAKVRVEVLKEIPVLKKPNLHTHPDRPATPAPSPAAKPRTRH